MGFFRRRRRDSDGPRPKETDAAPPTQPPGRSKGTPPVRPSQRPPGTQGQRPSSAPQGPSSGTKPPSAVPSSPAAPPELALPPPPLPLRLPEPVEEAHDHRGTYATCFVCGTALEHGACPKCGMTWVE